MKKIIILLTVFTFPFFFLKAQTHIDDSYFHPNDPVYTWDIGGSPYIITSDIKIRNGSNLIIESGVEVLFQGHYKIDVLGSINAIGDEDRQIIFSSYEKLPDIEKTPWNGIRFNNSDGEITASSRFHYCDISNSHKTGTICTTPDPESSGGAFYLNNFSDLEIYECKIFKNKVLGQGGAIGLFINSSPDISKCKIYDNTADKRGGAICMMIACNPDIIDNEFTDNVSLYKGGGAIAMGDLASGISCNPIIEGNYIADNHVSESGGGIFICNSQPDITNNTIEENTAQNNGGGIHIRLNSIVFLENNVFINNESSTDGGGLSIGSNGPDVTLSYCQFTGNIADNGGGVYINDADLLINNCQFNNNIASINGGGIYVLNSVSTIQNSSFEDNTATGNGGGIFMNDPVGGQLINPSTVNLNKFNSNTAILGSGLFLYRGSDPQVSTNFQYPAKVINNLFAENHATDKGVVYFQGDNTNTIFNHNTIANNTAPYFVSGVCYEYNGFFSLEFKNNIVSETVIDVYITTTYQRPTIYYSSLIFLNHLYLVYDNNANPPYVPNASPDFISTTDYHLSSSSPCIDPIGSDNSATLTAFDLDGNQRIINSKTDFGCYEYLSNPPPAHKINSNNFNLIESIKVYPNPAYDFLIISTPSEQSIDIEIYSSLGQRVYFSENSQINGEKIISLSDYKPGAYIIKLQNQSVIVKKRIIIQ